MVISGGGRREDVEAMITARQIELDEIKKLERYKNKGSVTKQTIEIRVPDIMMSDVYLAELKDEEKAAVRKSFLMHCTNILTSCIKILNKKYHRRQL